LVNYKVIEVKESFECILRYWLLRITDYTLV